MLHSAFAIIFVVIVTFKNIRCGYLLVEIEDDSPIPPRIETQPTLPPPPSTAPPPLPITTQAPGWYHIIHINIIKRHSKSYHLTWYLKYVNWNSMSPNVFKFELWESYFIFFFFSIIEGWIPEGEPCVPPYGYRNIITSREIASTPHGKCANGLECKLIGYAGHKCERSKPGM